MGTRSPFVECFKGRAKSFNVGKLQSQTLYRFRLCAVSVIHYDEIWLLHLDFYCAYAKFEYRLARLRITYVVIYI